MRWLVTEKFISLIQLQEGKISSVGVFGGSASDPEIVILKDMIPNSKVSFFGIENSGSSQNWHYLDLNEKNEVSLKFDLVICSQVLEHIWNLENFFNFLSNSINDGKFIFLNFPSSNMAHGSPDYFSAGYSPNVAMKYLAKRGVEEIISGTFGSKRYYFLTHILRRWVSEKEHERPLWNYKFLPGTVAGEIKRFIIEFPKRFISIFFSKAILSEIDFATESFYFGFRP
jgi:SAM-dependent methyltransferase